MRFKSPALTPALISQRVAVARGEQPADHVLRNVAIFDTFAGGFSVGDLAWVGDTLVGTHESYAGNAETDGSGLFAVPGFIDSHVHVESSLMTPARFQESVLPRGTTTAFWDPHEIANVMGHAGIEWAIESSRKLLMDLFVLVPSCVPATHLETSGATLGSADLARYVGRPGVAGLAEFMNYPGVLFADAEVTTKLSLFSQTLRDGHCPMLSGRDLNAYLCGGINACHECTSAAEAREKLRKGMHVLIREGSCAKDAHALLPLLNELTSAALALCSDDRNPLDVESAGHIDAIVNMALRAGISPDAVFRAASWSAARAFGYADRGVLAPGYLADIVLLEQMEPGNWKGGCRVRGVVKKGRWVHSDELGQVAGSRPVSQRTNVTLKDFSAQKLRVNGGSRVRVIGVLPGKIVTESRTAELPCSGGEVHGDPARDLLKLAVVERHHGTGNVGVGFVSGFGLKRGAIASSIGHDSHNITVVGVSDRAMVAAVEAVRDLDGGIVVVDENGTLLASLALPVGGLMTDAPPAAVAECLRSLKAAAGSLGCGLDEPFLQLSFLALPVIPSLKLTDRGLVDVERFALVSIMAE